MYTVHILFIIYPAPDTHRVSGTKNAEYSDPAESELLDPLQLYYYVTEDFPPCSTGLRPLRSRCPAHIEIHKNQYIYTHVYQQGKETAVHYCS